VLAIISSAALVNLIGVQAAVLRDFRSKTMPFYCLYLLAVCGHLGMVVTGDAFNLYVLLEISALSGYALLAIGNERAPLSTLNYLFIGTIGASLYLLGVGYLYIQTGTLNMHDLARILAQVGPTKTVLASLGLILTGVFIKMAFFPLSAWLPNAYSSASTSAASLIGPMTTKVMVYVMARMAFTVYGPQLSLHLPGVSDIIVWTAAVAIVISGFQALASRNLRLMLAYILIAEVAYMVGGLWLGNRIGATGAILHIANDAVMTLCVFLAAGCMRFRVGVLDFSNLGGLFQKMPWTMLGFVLGAMSMIGVPPFCGFFSKWYLLLGGMQAGRWEFVLALLFSSLINVILFFRIFEIAYFQAEAPSGQGNHHARHVEAVAIQEAPVSMVATLIFTGVCLIGMGLLTSTLTRIIGLAIPADLI